MRYTQEQVSVITAPLGDASVIAAAGSGKTSATALRVAYLLKKHGVEPRSLAALTFGKQASATLLERIVHAVEDKISGPVHGMPDLFVGTIHSWAMHVLKAHIPRFRKFEVLSEAERRLLVRRRFDHLGIGCIPRLAASTKGHDGQSFLSIAPEDVALFLAAIDRARDECLLDDALPPELLFSLNAYEALLEREAAWDYAGLLQTFLRALTNTDDADCLLLQQEIGSRLRFLHADEAQDLDRAMWRLLLRLREFGVGVWCVGDHRQSVYRWRSADPETFLEFPEQVGAQVYTLSANFRSSKAVVSVANSFSKRFLSERDDATMQAASHHESEDGDIAAVRFPTQIEQYCWIARRFKLLLGVAWRDKLGSPARGLSQSDMTVLVRTRRQMADVAAALRAEGFNVVVSGAEGLLVAPEAQALATAADYLGGGRASWDRKQRRIVTAPVSENDVRAAVRNAFILDDESVERGIEWLRALPLSPDSERPLCLIELLETWLQVMGVQFVGDGGAQEEVRWLAIRRVLNAAAAYQRWGFAAPLQTKIKGFSRWLRIEAGSVLKDEREDDGLRITPDAVTVQTCHNAKGLEYAVVAVPDLADGRFPTRPRPSDLWQVLPRRSFTPAQVRRLDGTASDKLRDEANLFYVAITRSAKYLLLAYAPPEDAKPPRPSPFFEFMEQHPAVSRDPDQLPRAVAPDADRLPPTPRHETTMLQVTATQLACYWACPRQFYLRVVLGFPPPLVEALGFGRGLHDSAWEVHRRARAGEELSPAEVEDITMRHFHTPMAGQDTRSALEAASIEALHGYVQRHWQEDSHTKIVAAEQEVRLDLGLMTLIGRVDLVTQDTMGTTLVELKTATSHQRDPEQMVAKTYALALQASAGLLPSRVATRTIAANGVNDQTTIVTPEVISEMRRRILEAGYGITHRRFMPLPVAGAETCATCDAQRICRHRRPMQEARCTNCQRA